MNSVTNTDEEIVAAIQKTFSNIIYIFKIGSSGMRNNGMYRLCFGNVRGTIIEYILSLQETINRQFDKLVNRTAVLLNSKSTSNSSNEIKGLIIAGVLKRNNVPICLLSRTTSLLSKSAATKWLTRVVSIGDILEFFEDPSKSIDECIQLLQSQLSNMKLINDITELVLSVPVDVVSWIEQTKQSTCEILLKVTSDITEIMNEAKMHRKVYQLQGDITSKIYESKTLDIMISEKEHGHNVIKLGPIGDDNVHMYALATGFIPGRNMCNGCPNGIMPELHTRSFPNYFGNFSMRDSMDLIQKLTIIYTNYIVHGDLHFENIMISDELGVKLVDWGDSRDLSDLPNVLIIKSIHVEIDDFIYQIRTLCRNINKVYMNTEDIDRAEPLYHLIEGLLEIKKMVSKQIFVHTNTDIA